MRRAGVFIASVGSPSRRWIDDVRTLAASERSRLVARVRTMMTTRVRTLSGPVRTCELHLRPDSKGELSGPPVRLDVNVDRPDAPH
jgi:hypothetical protein